MRWCAQEVRGRGGDRLEYFSETLNLALVKAVIAHAGRLVTLSDTAAVFDVRWAHFYAEEEMDTFVELPDNEPADTRASHVEKLRRALHGTRPAAAGWGRWAETRACQLGTLSRCCFRNHSGSVAGAAHGDDTFVAGPREEVLKRSAAQKEIGDMGSADWAWVW